MTDGRVGRMSNELGLTVERKHRWTMVDGPGVG
jgi:hypothetical protein